MRKLLLAATFAFTTSLFALDKVPGKVTQRKFIEEVAISDIGGNSMKVVRWAVSPSVSVFNHTGAPVELVFSHASAQINAALEPVKFQVSVLEPNSTAAPLKIVYCNRDQFPQTLKKYGAQQIGGRFWAYYRWWDSRYQVERAVAVISVEQGSEAQAKESTLRALMILLGFGGWSNEMVDSVLGPNRQQPRTELTDFDKKLLPFFFKNVQPGWEAFQVRRAFDKAWP
jgi:hypothetical protein